MDLIQFEIFFAGWTSDNFLICMLVAKPALCMNRLMDFLVRATQIIDVVCIDSCLLPHVETFCTNNIYTANHWDTWRCTSFFSGPSLVTPYLSPPLLAQVMAESPAWFQWQHRKSNTPLPNPTLVEVHEWVLPSHCHRDDCTLRHGQLLRWMDIAACLSG